MPSTTTTATICTNFWRFLNTARKPNLQSVNFYRYAIAQLFKSTRTRQSPWIIGFWAGASVFSWLRKRTAPKKVRLTRKTLKPGASYIVRVPKGEGPVGSDLSAITGDLIKDVPISRRQLKNMDRTRR